jgi:glycerophosphoryl diester phosphodiesterase
MKKYYALLSLLLIGLSVHGQVKIIGHRGSSYQAPENTIASANLAWSQNADGVETDIYLSKDNKIMCIHDRSTKRTSGQDYKIPETDSKTIRKLDVGSFKDAKYKGEKIPFLKELIRTVPANKELVVELKCGPEVIPFLKKTIDKYGKGKNIVFIGFNFETISETKKSFPNHHCYWLCGNREDFDKTIDKFPASGLDGFDLNYSMIDDVVMSKAAELHAEVYSWTVDNPEEAKRLISLGVKAITTNRPGWLREQLNL